VSLKISIVVITHNKCAYLAGVLGALEQVRFPREDFEVVVVDDGSTDGTAEFLAGYRPGYRFRASRQANAGRAAARNACARLARGRLLMFLDDDCLVHPDSLSALWQAHEREPGALLLSSVRHVAIGHVAQVLQGISDDACVEWGSLGELAPVDEEYVLAGLMREILLLGIERIAVPWLAAPGTAVSIGAETFARLGGYDEAFVSYGMEDFDFAYRYDLDTGCFRWVPDSCLYHLDHGHKRAVLFKETAVSTRTFYEKFRERAEIAQLVKFLCGAISFRDFNNQVAARRGMAAIDAMDVRFSPYGMVRYRDRQHSGQYVADKPLEYSPVQEFRLRFLIDKIQRDMAQVEPDGTVAQFTDIPARRILVVAPHMDDEVIGCGGLIHTAAAAGASVTVLYLTDGGSRNLSADEHERMCRDRRVESGRAADTLGVERCIYLDIPERRLSTAVLDPAPIVRVLDETRPDLVLVPSGFEHHPDHRAAHDWLQRGLAATPLRPTVYCYEVWGSCRPNQVLVLGESAWRNKVEALLMYRSQVQTLDYVKLMRFIATLRGRHSGTPDARGEAYRRLADSDLGAVTC
jgi:LmbE family N-acetylglucosaminyl deacetylase/glycosyltransferase involved in cell wall biosynthesis